MCPDAVLLSAYFDGQLSEEQNRDIYAHLAQCLPCHLRIDKYTQQRESLLAQLADIGTLEYQDASRLSSLKLYRKSSHRISIPTSAAALLLTALVFSVIMNIIPVFKEKNPIPSLDEPVLYYKNIIQLTIKPNDVDEFMDLLEKNHGHTANFIREIPGDLLVERWGSPQIVRIDNKKNQP